MLPHARIRAVFKWCGAVVTAVVLVVGVASWWWYAAWYGPSAA